MKYYIASGFTNIEPVRALKKRLDEIGWEHTYDWTVEQGTTFEETAQLEINAVSEADVVIVLLPGGRGTHAELGCAIGQTLLGKALVEEGIAESAERRIVLYSATPDQDFGTQYPGCCIFYHHPLVERFTDLDVMFGSLIGAH